MRGPGGRAARMAGRAGRAWRRPPPAVFAAALAGCLAAGLPAAAQPRGAEAAPELAGSGPLGVAERGEELVILFRGADAARAAVAREGRDLLVTFPGAAPRLDAEALQRRVAGWAEGVSLGFDALALRLSPGTAASWDQGAAAGGLRIRLARQPAPEDAAEDRAEEPTPEAERQGEFRLRLLEAQQLLLTGQLGEARRRYDALRQEMPARAEPVAGLAAVEREAGRARRSLALYREALLLGPSDPWIAAPLAAAERERAPRLRSAAEHRVQEGGVATDRAGITLGEVEVAQPVGEAWRIGAILGLAHVDARQIRRAGGAVERFTGERTRAELHAQHEATDGVTVTGSLFATPDTLGLGLRAAFPDDRGQTLLRAEYRRPNWDFVESIVEGGTRDRLAVGRVQRITPDLTGRLELGFNRYGIPGEDGDLVRAFSVAAELRLAGLAGIRGLSTAYVLEGEYVTRSDRRRDAGGAEFQPLPVVDREVHALTLAYAGASGATVEEGRFVYQLSGGYGLDRYGRSGPLVLGTLGYSFGRFELAARAGHVRNIGRTRGNTTTVGAALTWVF